jgi:hypothetical protein
MAISGVETKSCGIADGRRKEEAKELTNKRLDA